ncbi:LysE family translocator [Streptomyces albidoflavus]
MMPRMIDPHRLLAFCTMSVLLSAVPGPSVLFVVGRALAHGRRTALASVLGNALGIGTLVQTSALVFGLIKCAGAAYLIHLGVKAVRASWRSRDRAAAFAPAPSGERGSVRAGFLVGVTNPKSVVFLTAMLPQFVDREAGHVTLQMLVLGLAGAVLALVSDGLWGLTASAARTWFGRSPRRMAMVGGAGGLAMIGLGTTVAVTGRAD